MVFVFGTQMRLLFTACCLQPNGTPNKLKYQRVHAVTTKPQPRLYSSEEHLLDLLLK